MKQLSILVYLVIAAILTFTVFSKKESNYNSTPSSINLVNVQSPKADLIQKPTNFVPQSQLTSPKSGQIMVYAAKFPKEGKIGIMDSSSIDNPMDNVFHIQINQEILPNTKAYLDYELFGVQDFNSVCKGINDQISFGGLFVKISNSWSNQSEEISSEYLRKGDNQIRFSIPANCEFGYKIKNVKLRLISSNDSERKLVVNQPSTHYYFKKYGYINGFATGKGSENVKFYSNGKLLRSHQSSFEGCIEKTQDSLESWQTIITAEFQDGEKLSTLLNFDKASLWDYSVDYQAQIPYSESFAQRNQATELKLEGFLLQVEKTSLKTNTKLSVTGLRAEDMALMGSSMVNVTGVNKGFRCLPHGNQFEKEIKIHLAYDTASIPRGYSAKDIRTYYYDETSSRWIMLPLDTVDIAKNEVVSYTNHFTDFVNAILKTPESPQTQAFTPTSMKDIKFANPMAGFNPIAPPTANNSGTANLSYPIEIPAGRQGMQPQLAITYNSEGGNGWLGVGWDLNIPSISVETRWGVPHYDAFFETESYLVNGEQLLPLVHRSNYVSRDTTVVSKVFDQRVEGAFSKTIRHGKSPKTYWWEVIDKQGVKYYYGKYSADTAVNAACVLKDDNGNVAYWALAEVRDLHGNFVKYNYDKIYSSGSADTTFKGSQLYIKKIVYTGFGNTEGKYTIDFATTADTTQMGNDVQISSRYGFKVVTDRKLESILVKYDGAFIRKYRMLYTSGKVGQ